MLIHRDSVKTPEERPHHTGEQDMTVPQMSEIVEQYLHSSGEHDPKAGSLSEDFFNGNLYNHCPVLLSNDLAHIDNQNSLLKQKTVILHLEDCVNNYNENVDSDRVEAVKENGEGDKIYIENERNSDEECQKEACVNGSDSEHSLQGLSNIENFELDSNKNESDDVNNVSVQGGETHHSDPESEPTNHLNSSCEESCEDNTTPNYDVATGASADKPKEEDGEEEEPDSDTPTCAEDHHEKLICTDDKITSHPTSINHHNGDIPGTHDIYELEMESKLDCTLSDAEEEKLAAKPATVHRVTFSSQHQVASEDSNGSLLVTFCPIEEKIQKSEKDSTRKEAKRVKYLEGIYPSLPTEKLIEAKEGSDLTQENEEESDTESDIDGWDNPFQPEGEVSLDAELILKMWKVGRGEVEPEPEPEPEPVTAEGPTQPGDSPPTGGDNSRTPGGQVAASPAESSPAGGCDPVPVVLENNSTTTDTAGGGGGEKKENQVALIYRQKNKILLKKQCNLM